MDEIASISAQIQPVKGLAGSGESESAGPDDSFASMLGNRVEDMIAKQEKADRLTRQYAAGQIDDIGEVTKAVTRADLALTLGLEVRDRAINAYQQISRMQI